MPWHWDGGWHMGWMAVWWFAGILLLIALVWAFTSATRTAGGPPERRRDPEDILKERYARGEIDRDTYERMRDDLRG